MEETAGADLISLFMSLDDWPDNQNPSSQPPADACLLGFVIANIVGIMYYPGKINGREMVSLVREPLNTHDHNAIKVLNSKTLQVGFIERTVAAVLSPLIDSRLISVEGIVPNSCCAGNKCEIRCQVYIFGTLEAFNHVRNTITGFGMELIPHSNVSFYLSEAAVVKKMNGGGERKSVDEVFKLANENVCKNAAMEPVEPPNEVIRSPLLLHQKEGLGWLLQRENSGELPPFWEEKDKKFINVLSNYQTHKRPEPLRGGILADDMGLGKTLTLLSLIAFDRFGSTVSSSDNAGVEENVEEYAKKGKRSRLSEKSAETPKKLKTEDAQFGRNQKEKAVGVVDEAARISDKRTTLVVCPSSVCSSWITQLEEHTNPGKLKVYIYYGERTKDVEELKKYDIVLTTYNTLATEASCSDSPMNKIEWWRVILDEAHVIKNENAQQSKAVTNLKANRRWVVTGTPIRNGSVDLFSLMEFLRFEPFSIKCYWRSLVQQPLAQGNKNGLSRLQVMLASITLRRTKGNDLIGLPPKTLQTCYVELSLKERELYDLIEGKARSVIQEYISDGSLVRSYSIVLCVLLRLRQICTCLTLLPQDVRAWFPSRCIEDVSSNPNLLKNMVVMLQDGEDFDCPICISPPTDLVITCCAHIFCQSCILKILQQTKPCCPLCHHSLSQSDVFSAPSESSDANHTKISSSNITSSKVSALLTLLKESRDQNPATKSVVFSQFQTMLLLLEKPLKDAGFKILRLDGPMNAKRRTQVIEEFQVPGVDGPTVLLASLKASGASINLTVASRVYLLEPWWNPTVEEQAMDRVHRIGQKEDVKIVRLIAQNSIEERVLELQGKKKKLATDAFGRKCKKNKKEVMVHDIRMLMSL